MAGVVPLVGAAVPEVVAPEVAVRDGLAPAVVEAPVVDVAAGCVDAVLSAGFENNPPAAAGWVEGAAVVPEAPAAVVFGAPRLNKPPLAGAAAGVEEGVAEEVVAPRLNVGFCGVADEVAGVVVV